MKLFLLKDIPKVGFAGEIIKVSDGYAKNFLLPNKAGVEVTAENEAFYVKKIKNIENRKEAVATEQSMLSEKINHMNFVLKRKIHDDQRLYAAINASDIVELLHEAGVKIGKSQVIFDKSIKKAGQYKVTIKLSSKLQPQCTIKVVGL